MKLPKWLRTTGQEMKTEPAPKQKALTTLGGFFETWKSLSDEKSISTKLLEANKEWVYRNNDVIAKEVATIDFKLYRIDFKGGKYEYTEIEQHPILDILDRFNDTTTKADAIYNTASHKKLTGDAFWYLDGNGPNINNIFILPPDKITLEIGDFTDASDMLVEGYTYKDTIDGKQVEHTYTPDEVIHIKTPNPRNMFRGYGAVEAASDTIDLDNLTTETTKKYFLQGAITNFVLATEGKISADQLKRLKAEMKSAYGGVNNAYNTMVLGNGLKPLPISFSNKDQEFIAQLEWYRDKIMVIFGNTKASLGIIDDVNRASHESSIIAWKRNSVKPEMCALVDTLNEFLVPRFGKNLILGFGDPIPEDRQAKINELNAAFAQAKNPILTRNEARRLLGYDSMPGEDELPPLSQAGPLIPPPLKHVNIKAVWRRNGLFKRKAAYEALFNEVKPVVKKLVKDRKQKKTRTKAPVISKTFTPDRIMKYYEKQIHVVEVIEARFENAVQQFLGRLEEKVLRNLDGELDTKKTVTKDLYDEDDEITQAVIDFAPLLQDVAVAAGQQAFNLLELDTPYIPKDMIGYIQDNVRKFTKSMLDTDRDRLTGIISEGIKDGKSVPQIKTDIQEAFSSIKKNQAQVITRTEVIRTSNAAALDAFKESGVVEGKQWLTAGATDECAQYEGQVESLDGNFYSSDSEFQDGDPPLHPNCRCVLLPVLTEQKAFEPVPINERELLQGKIADLEKQIDKRTKEYKEIRSKYIDNQAYITALEKYLDGRTAEVTAEDSQATE